MLVAVCDRHPDELRKAGSARTISIDGNSVEIDLCGDCQEAFNDALAPYVEAARKLPIIGGRGKLTRPVVRPRTRVAVPQPEPVAVVEEVAEEPAAIVESELEPEYVTPDAEERRAIRAWAAENDIYVYARGSIAREVVNRYRAS